LWATQEAALTHTPDLLMPECSICRAIAAHGRVNIHPPNAA
jgi:hypothetical protein